MSQYTVRSSGQASNVFWRDHGQPIHGTQASPTIASPEIQQFDAQTTNAWRSAGELSDSLFERNAPNACMTCTHPRKFYSAALATSPPSRASVLSAARIHRCQLCRLPGHLGGVKKCHVRRPRCPDVIPSEEFIRPTIGIEPIPVPVNDDRKVGFNIPVQSRQREVGHFF